MALNAFIGNPWLFTRKGFGRLKRRLVRVPDKTVERTINDRIRFEFTPLSYLDDGDYRAMLTASYDIALCDMLRKTLCPGDIFIDAGANIGYISAVAASLIGPSGEIHGFEPLKECYERLHVLQTLNPHYKFVFNNAALGQHPGVLPISYEPRGGSRNATLVHDGEGSVTRLVQVLRLDDYIFANISAPERIKILKIDVEGFEFPVLLGAKKFFQKTAHRPLIVCEIQPWTLPKCGFTLGEFESYMREFGYQAYHSVRRTKKVDLRLLADMTVVLFGTEAHQH